jgi:hypothetical protein
LLNLFQDEKSEILYTIGFVGAVSNARSMHTISVVIGNSFICVRASPNVRLTVLSTGVRKQKFGVKKLH